MQTSSPTADPPTLYRLLAPPDGPLLVDPDGSTLLPSTVLPADDRLAAAFRGFVEHDGQLVGVLHRARRCVGVLTLPTDAPKPEREAARLAHAAQTDAEPLTAVYERDVPIGWSDPAWPDPTLDRRLRAAIADRQHRLLCPRGRVTLTPLAGRANLTLARCEPFAAVPRPEFAELTASQLDVVRLAAAGYSTAEIGRRTGRSTETVRTHLRDTYRRLGVNHRADLVPVLEDWRRWIRIESPYLAARAG